MLQLVLDLVLLEIAVGTADSLSRALKHALAYSVQVWAAMLSRVLTSAEEVHRVLSTAAPAVLSMACNACRPWTGGMRVQLPSRIVVP